MENNGRGRQLERRKRYIDKSRILEEEKVGERQTDRARKREDQ